MFETTNQGCFQQHTLHTAQADSELAAQSVGEMGEIHPAPGLGTLW